MKFLFDYFPIVCFFIAYKFYGIYVATAVTIAASALQVAAYWIRTKRFEKLHIITLISVAVLGGTTLLLHNEIFIKWKPSIIYWTFSLVLLVSHYVGHRPIIYRMLADKINLPLKVWYQINLSWTIFFLLLGFLNLYVVYHFSTNAWVNFKLFGTLGLTAIFILIQALYMSRFMENKKAIEKNKG